METELGKYDDALWLYNMHIFAIIVSCVYSFVKFLSMDRNSQNGLAPPLGDAAIRTEGAELLPLLASLPTWAGVMWL